MIRERLHVSSSYTSNHLHMPVHCWFRFNGSCTHWNECFEILYTFLPPDLFSVAAGSNLKHMDCLTKERNMVVVFFSEMEICPSISPHCCKCHLTQTLKAIISQKLHTSQFFLSFFFAVSVQNPSKLSLRNSYKAIEPWISEMCFYQLDGLLCTFILTDSICNISTTCVGAKFPFFSCLNELLLLIDSSKCANCH